MTQLQTSQTVVDAALVSDALAQYHHTNSRSTKMSVHAPDQTGVLPRDLLLHSVFASRKFVGPCVRPNWANRLVFDAPNLRVIASGPQPDQRDADLYAYLLAHAVAQQSLTVSVRMSALFAHFDLRPSGNAQSLILDRLKRLRMFTIEVQAPKYYVCGGLIDSFAGIDAGGKHSYREMTITLGNYFAPVLLEKAILINFEERKLLAGNPLAAWMHGYFATNSGRKYISVEALQQLSGRQDQATKDFLADVRKAAADLEQLPGWKVELPRSAKYIKTSGDITITREGKSKLVPHEANRGTYVAPKTMAEKRDRLAKLEYASVTLKQEIAEAELEAEAKLKASSLH